MIQDKVFPVVPSRKTAKAWQVNAHTWCFHCGGLRTFGKTKREAEQKYLFLHIM